MEKRQRQDGERLTPALVVIMDTKAPLLILDIAKDIGERLLNKTSVAPFPAKVIGASSPGPAVTVIGPQIDACLPFIEDLYFANSSQLESSKMEACMSYRSFLDDEGDLAIHLVLSLEEFCKSRAYVRDNVTDFNREGLPKNPLFRHVCIRQTNGLIGEIYRLEGQNNAPKLICTLDTQNFLVNFSPDSLVDRHWNTSPASDKELRIMTFNILADGLSGKTPNQGGFTGFIRPILNWSHRQGRLVEELFRFQPHVIACHEMDHWTGELEFVFREKGFEGVFVPKRDSPCLQFGNPSDGCVVAYDVNRLKLLNHDFFHLGETDNQIAVVLTLQEILIPEKEYLVCGTHLKATKTEEGEIIRTRQMDTICTNLLERNRVKERDVFICTDLNAVPTSSTYSKATHTHGLKSAMKELRGAEPPFTTTKRRRGEYSVQHTIDYIFYQGKMVKPLRYVEIPSDMGFMPSFKYPSDHFSLCVAFDTL